MQPPALPCSPGHSRSRPGRRERSPALIAHPLRQAIALGLCLAWSLTGCGLPGFPTESRPPVSAGPTEPTLAAVPEWALASPSRVVDAEIGIGSGANLQEATRHALRDVAARLSVSVESRLRDSMFDDGETSIERLEQVIETRVTGARFRGWERTRSEERDGVFWTEIRIDRRRLARDSELELAQLARDIDLRLESASLSPLRLLLELEATAPDRRRVEDLVSLLDVLEPKFRRVAFDARRDQWRDIDEAARRALIFEVRADLASREIANWIETSLVEDRLRTRVGDCQSPDAICIDIRSEVTEAHVASRHVARIRATLALLEPSGTLLRERKIEGRGDSKSNRARARRKALDDLRQSLVAISLLGGLASR